MTLTTCVYMGSFFIAISKLRINKKMLLNHTIIVIRVMIRQILKIRKTYFQERYFDEVSSILIPGLFFCLIALLTTKTRPQPTITSWKYDSCQSETSHPVL